MSFLSAWLPTLARTSQVCCGILRWPGLSSDYLIRLHHGFRPFSSLISSIRAFYSLISLFKHSISWIKLSSGLGWAGSLEACFFFGCFWAMRSTSVISCKADSFCLYTQDLMACSCYLSLLWNEHQQIHLTVKSSWTTRIDDVDAEKRSHTYNLDSD